MTPRGVLTATSMAVGLAALIARAVALALTDIDRGIRSIHLDTVPDVIPAWVDAGWDL